MTKKQLKKFKKKFLSVSSLDDKKAIIIEICNFSNIYNPCISDDDYFLAFEQLKEVVLCLK